MVAWGDPAAIRRRVDANFAAGADQVVLNLVIADLARPYVEELRVLAELNEHG